ncbi:MAG: T9SS type A sorting domain-containing protein [Flavobacteriales bacterium]|nr:MAG: T9SS type A sorting domain-containing protein [Flavobacteriales bacterium]
MMVRAVLVQLLLFAAHIAASQAPAIQWQLCSGGADVEDQPDVIQTMDGGFVMVSTTYSVDGDAAGNHGSADVLVKKVDGVGNNEWIKVLGGSSWELSNAIRQTNDGGYLVLGTTSSNDGDVMGHHGDSDIWLLKLDVVGDIEWQRCLGGSGSDGIGYVDDSWSSILELTNDGGCLITGTTTSDDGDVVGWHPGYSQGQARNDIWVVKVDGTGAIQWQRALGGSGSEFIGRMVSTSDGGCILVGDTESPDGDVVGWHAGIGQNGVNDDLWVVKLSSMGAIEWQRTLGGYEDEFAQDVLETPDGGFIASARSCSMDGDLVNNVQGLVWWVVKLDQSGAVEWEKSLGGLYGNSVLDMALAATGGYLIGGGLLGPGADAPCYHGTAQDAMEDAWVVKLAPAGTIEWQLCLGGTGLDEYGSLGGAFVATPDGGCVIGALSYSDDGDVTNNQGNGDAWIAKVSNTGALAWQRALGGSGLDHPSSIRITSDGGFLVSGITASNNGDVSGNHGGLDTWILELAGDGSGLNEFPFQGFIISPVPATNEVRITTPMPYPDTRATVIDALGQEVESAAMGGTDLWLDVGHLPRGVYLVKLSTKGASRSQRVVLE